MNMFINDIVEGKIHVKYPCAVVFADLNGLKRVNDEQGHSEGDSMLKRAAEILNQVFAGALVYRAGGDEFMIIAPNADEASIEAKLKEINKYADDEDGIHFAVGSYILHEGDDILTAMRKADERMYLNKKAYYEAHPERKYR